MSASPRDLLKPRSQRLAEVAEAVQLQSGMADGQMVTFGCVLAPGGTTSQLAVSAGEYALAGSLVSFTAVAGQSIASGQSVWTANPTNTGAGQTCSVLVEADGTGALFLTQGAITTGTPVTPSPTGSRIVLGTLAIPASFTFGTTALTTNICKTLAYSAGNVNPAGTQSGSGSTGGF